MQLAQTQIAGLLEKAEAADSVPLQDGLTIPDEISRRETRVAALREAKEAMEARARERHAGEQAAYEAKLAARRESEESTGRKAGNPSPRRKVRVPRTNTTSPTRKAGS